MLSFLQSSVDNYNDSSYRFDTLPYKNLLTCLISTKVIDMEEENLLREGYDEELVESLFNEFMPVFSKTYSDEQALLEVFKSKVEQLFLTKKADFYRSEKIVQEADYNRLWNHAWGRVFKHMSQNAQIFQGYDLRERAALQLWTEPLLKILNAHRQKIEDQLELYAIDCGRPRKYQLSDFDGSEIGEMKLNFLQFLSQLNLCGLKEQSAVIHQYLYFSKLVANAQIKKYKVELSAFAVVAVTPVLRNMLLLSGKLYNEQTHAYWISRELQFIHCFAQAILDLPGFDIPFNVFDYTLGFSSFADKVKAYQTSVVRLEESWMTSIHGISSSNKKRPKKSKSPFATSAAAEKNMIIQHASRSSIPIPSLNLEDLQVASSPPPMHITSKSGKKLTPRSLSDKDVVHMDTLLSELKGVMGEESDQDEPIKSPRKAHFKRKK